MIDKAGTTLTAKYHRVYDVDSKTNYIIYNGDVVRQTTFKQHPMFHINCKTGKSKPLNSNIKYIIEDMRGYLPEVV